MTTLSMSGSSNAKLLPTRKSAAIATVLTVVTSFSVFALPAKADAPGYRFERTRFILALASAPRSDL